MLWEVILDDEIIVNKNREEINMINEIFLRVAQQFYDREQNNIPDLVNMNKKFISIIVNILNKNFPKPKPLLIHESESFVTAEKIQASRLNIFEEELTKKQQEFAQSMALPIPEKPDFEDGSRDGPIRELDAMIKKTIDERNFDIQQITNNFNKSEAENFIKSSEITNKKQITWADNLVENPKMKITDIDLISKKISLEERVQKLEKKVGALVAMIEKLLE